MPLILCPVGHVIYFGMSCTASRPSPSRLFLFIMGRKLHLVGRSKESELQQGHKEQILWYRVM